MTSPIQRISYDVLREIMLYADENTPIMGLDEPFFDIKLLVPPITVSHVCSSWRRALLSDPTMWTCLLVNTMKPNGIMELLRRSGSAPLTVVLHLNNACEMGYKEILAMLSALFEQIHRFSALYMRIELWDNRYPFSEIMKASVGVIMSSFQRPAPTLQTLSFSYSHFGIGRNFNPEYAAITDLFTGNAPNLKRVHHRLSREFREPHSAAFNNISELYLTPPFLMWFDSLLDLLAASPYLKLFHFHDIFHDVQVISDPSSERKVHLPHLEKLKLEVNTTAEISDLFMKHVTFPSNTIWHISIPCLPDFVKWPSLRQLLSQARFTDLDTRISPQSGSFSFAEDPTDNRPHVNIFTCQYSTVEELRSLWQPMIRILKSSHITRMDLQPDDLRNDDRLLQIIFAEMSNLKSLIIGSTWKSPADTNMARIMCLKALITETDGTNSVGSLVEPDSESADTSALDPASQFGLQMPILCPMLRTVELVLWAPLQTEQTEIISKCSDVRRKIGYPLQIWANYPRTDKGVLEHTLQRLDDAIGVAIYPT